MYPFALIATLVVGRWREQIMHWSVLLLFLSLSLLVAAGKSQDGADKAKDIIPQARPVFTWLKAVKDGDQKQLKTVFSERMRKTFDEEGWDRVLKTYQEVFKKDFGDYKLEDFAFEYTGGEEEGKVSVVHKGKRLSGLRVIKEKTDWKVDER